MATGPEHYREAERLAGMAHRFTYGDGADPVVGAALAAEAQVHATLALTAATALATISDHAAVRTVNDWWAVAGPQDPENGDGERR
ncbi:hypothetical protein [Streptomyces canus]|uniref:hypothetical protein n=1 Tax=Streptomyces canus TaxID=58343 RepID=UPI003CEB620D